MREQNKRFEELNQFVQDNLIKIIVMVLLLIVLLALILFNNRGEGDIFANLSENVMQSEENMESEENGVLEANMVSPTDKSVTPMNSNESLQEIYVDVKGAVHNPNMYSFSSGSRVFDAIEAAGGFTAEAATESINQAKLLEDQMLLYIQTRDEIQELKDNPVEVDSVFNTFSESNDTNIEDSLININIANEIELMTLPNIGPKKAEAIIKYRQDNGSFSAIEDIMNVSGIGEKTFESLKDSISVGP